MKKVIILLVALVGMISAMAQWVPQNSGTTAQLKSVFFTDANAGFVVGDDDRIFITIDGGTNWGTWSSGTNLDLYSVCFTDANTGYAVGEFSIWTDPRGTIYKTIDGGINWTAVLDLGENSVLNSVFFTDASTGYAVGFSGTGWGWPGSGYLYKTTDGGINWVLQFSPSPSSGPFYSVFFPNETTGFVVGYEGSIFKTTNEGSDWIALSSGTTKNLNSIYFTDTDTGYAVGDTGTIIKTTNGGSDWFALSSGTTSTLSSIYFTDSNVGYTVGDTGIILKTTNGGIDWFTLSSETNYCLRSVFFLDANTGYVVGDGGTILKTTNGGLAGLYEIGTSSKFLKIFPNPATDKITISSPAITGNTLLSIFNVSGEKVVERRLTDNETQIDISTLPRGVYFVRLQNEKMVEVGKMVKE
jgi:photosystem II stability/assembly factor-like uncharacterized protein